MTKKLVHNISTGSQLIIITLLLASCFVINKSLFNGIITAKTLWVQTISIGVIVFLSIDIWFVEKVKIKLADILVLLLCLWMICRELFSSMPHAYPQKYILNILIYTSLYLFARSIGDNTRTIKAIIVIYLLTVTFQAFIGLLQLYGFQHSHHTLFKITGTFHNPGPFSGFVVSGLPMALALYFMTKTNKEGDNEETARTNLNKSLVNRYWSLVNWDKILNYFAQFVIVVLLLVLPAARSRAAWLGGIVGCIFVLLYHKGPLRNIRKSLKDTLRNSVLSLRFSALAKKRYAVPLIILILFSSLFGLYKFKQGSADGRLLMWQVSWEMIKDKPILGWGQGGFDANYANYQAEWFKSGKGTKAQEMVAGSPEAPFNELIRVVVNYGAVGVIFVFAMLIILFLKEPQKNAEVHGDSLRNSVLTFRFSLVLKGGLISILIFSLFSYPLDVTPILVQLILLVALVANQSIDYRLLDNEHRILNIERSELKQSVNRRSHIPYPLKFNFYGTNYRTLITKTTTAILLITILLFTSFDLKSTYIGQKHWQEAYQLYQYQIYEHSNEKYNLVLEYLPKNGQLLQMLGKSLTMKKRYSKAIEVLLKANERIANSIVYTTLGDCYRELGDYKKAELAYLKASYMEPHKFYPQYLLAKLYDKSGKNEKAQKAIKSLLAKEVKISSFAITEMKDELSRLLQK